VKRMLGFSMALTLALGAVAAPVAANGGNAWGKQIKEQCGVSYGQLVSAGKAAARAGLHPDFTPSGAKGFVTGPVFTVHCPPAK
jgi:hypothetical protein